VTSQSSSVLAYSPQGAKNKYVFVVQFRYSRNFPAYVNRRSDADVIKKVQPSYISLHKPIV